MDMSVQCGYLAGYSLWVDVRVLGMGRCVFISNDHTGL